MLIAFKPKEFLSVIPLGFIIIGVKKINCVLLAKRKEN
jgi:hypothetical protein